eukprot:354255-Chlamydomonas_euryale.AAC.2
MPERLYVIVSDRILWQGRCQVWGVERLIAMGKAEQPMPEDRMASSRLNTSYRKTVKSVRGNPGYGVHPCHSCLKELHATSSRQWA